MRKKLRLTLYRLGMTRHDGYTVYTEFIYTTRSAAEAAAAVKRAEKLGWFVWVEQRSDR